MKQWCSLLALLGAIVLHSTAFAVAAEIYGFGQGSWQEIRKAHAGEPLVVHFWGVTCVASRPGTVRNP